MGVVPNWYNCYVSAGRQRMIAAFCFLFLFTIEILPSPRIWSHKAMQRRWNALREKQMWWVFFIYNMEVIRTFSLFVSLSLPPSLSLSLSLSFSFSLSLSPYLTPLSPETSRCWQWLCSREEVDISDETSTKSDGLGKEIIRSPKRGIRRGRGNTQVSAGYWLDTQTTREVENDLVLFSLLLN